MWKRFRGWLAGVHLSDPVERQQAPLVQAIIIALIITLLPLSLVVFAVQPLGSAAITALANTAAVVLLAVALVVLRRGRFGAAVMLAALSFLLGFLPVIGGAVLDKNGAILIVCTIPITVVGLLAGRRHLLLIVAVSIAIVAAKVVMERLSIRLTAVTLPQGDGGPFTLVGFSVVVALVSLLLDRFSRSFRTALVAAGARERELDHLRAGLESTVADRTAALQAALAEVEGRAAEQSRLLDEVEQQRLVIRRLSVPVLPVSRTTLVMPLIGALDGPRLSQVQEQALLAIERLSARRLLLDITGVPVVDRQVAQGLLMVVQAGRLLGASVELIGIRPEAAQSIVALGLDLRDMATFSDLQTALRWDSGG